MRPTVNVTAGQRDVPAFIKPTFKKSLLKNPVSQAIDLPQNSNT
jgi:hypothetical protein